MFKSIYSKFNWGKNYQNLVEMCEILEMTLRNLKNFSATRFPNSVQTVFDTLIHDFKPVFQCVKDMSENHSNVDAKKKANEASVIIRTIQSKNFVLQLSGTSDIYEIFGLVTNLCQTVNIYPHERFDEVMKAIGLFNNMLTCIELDECIKHHVLLNPNDKKPFKCLWPRYYSCLKELELHQFKGVNIKMNMKLKVTLLN